MKNLLSILTIIALLSSCNDEFTMSVDPDDVIITYTDIETETLAKDGVETFLEQCNKRGIKLLFNHVRFVRFDSLTSNGTASRHAKRIYINPYSVTWKGSTSLRRRLIMHEMYHYFLQDYDGPDHRPNNEILMPDSTYMTTSIMRSFTPPHLTPPIRYTEKWEMLYNELFDFVSIENQI